MTVETGTLGVVHKDGFGQGPTEFDYTLKQGDRTREVLPTQLGNAGDGDRVEVRGREVNGRLVGSVVSTKAVRTLSAGQRSLAVVLVNWTGDQREPWTPAEVRQQIFDGGASLNAFYKEETYDQISFTGDVLGWYTIDAPSTGCNGQISWWQYKADQAAAADGKNLNGYDHVMYVFPQSDCSAGGMGIVNGPYSWIFGSIDPAITIHEMGHNLGLHHANSYSCTSNGSTVTISNNCTSWEYGDPFDVMGSGGAHHNSGWHLQKLGVLAPSDIKTITQSGTYTLHSALTQTSEPSTLRIPRTYGPNGSVLDYYYLEIRQPGGVFESDYMSFEPAVSGILIRLNPDPSVATQSRLLKGNPGGTAYWRWDAPLPAGSSFSDGGIEVGVTSASAGAATVAITVPDPPDTQAPSVPTGLRATLAGRDVQLAWTSSTDDHGVASYSVSRDGAEIGTTATPAFTDHSAAPGAHAYVVAAEDAAHNRSGLSAPATATVPGVSPPSSGAGPGPGSGSVNGGSRANEAQRDRLAPRLQVLRKRSPGGRVSIQIRAVDARGVASIELFIGGRRRKAVRLSASSSAGTLRYMGPVPRGARSAVARATDRSGNRSTLRFRLPR
jgi:hypothetical protein